MENESSIKEIIRNSLEQVRTIIDADTIVGKQIVTSSGMVIIPISKLSMGFASGGLDLPTKTDEGGKKNFGGGGGTGVSVVPVGFLTITPEGKVDMIPMTSEKLTPVEVVAGLIYNSPDIIGRIKNVITNGYQESAASTGVDLDVDVQPELADEYRNQLILDADLAPVQDSDAAAETEQILYADEGERYADTKVGRRELKLSIKEQKKRDKEAAKLQKKADKSAAKMARIQAELMALNMALDAAQTPEEREYIQNAITEAKVNAQLEGEKQAEIVTQQKALAAAAPVSSYEVKSRSSRALTPEESQAQLEAEIRAFNAALAAASTADEQQRIIDVERDRLAYYTAAPRRSDVEINEFNSAMQAARTPAQKQAVIDAEKRAMLQPSTARVKTPEQMQFESEMNTLDTAYRAAKSEDEKKAILDVQKQTIINAKKRRNNAVDRAAREVQEFNAALAAARTPKEKHAIIQAEKKAMLQAGASAPVLTREQQELQSEMNALNSRMSHATTPAQQAAIIEAEKNAIIKAKQKKTRGNPAEEVLKFNAALAAAQTPEEKQAIIDAEKKAMLQPQKAPLDKKYTEFECEMSDLNSALANAKTRGEQNQLLEEQQEAIIKAKKRGLTKADAPEDEIVKGIAAFNAALLAAETEEQQQKLIDIEKRALLKAQKEIEVKNAEQEVFEAEMSGYDEAYAAAQSDLEKLTILEAQKQAIIKAKKKGVTKAQKAAKAGKEATAQQARLDILEAELVALKSALARAESELEKKALIDAEKDALIEAKKQVALSEGAIADEAELSEAIAEPVTKADKRADRKAKKLSKKQAEEEEAPVPHNKRGKISEKTLDSGTVK